MFPQQQYYSEVTHQFCIVYRKREDAFNMQAFHYHNVYELYLFLSGERLLFYRDRLYHITAGDIVFIPKNELHCFTDANIPGHSMFLVDFHEDFLRHFLSVITLIPDCFGKDIIVISPAMEQQSILRRYFQELLDEYEQRLPYGNIQLKLKLSSLLITLSRLQDLYGEKQEAVSQKQFVVSQVMKYINENYQRRLTLQEIADHVTYSTNYLCAYFKKYSGLTITEYWNNVRIQKAQDYLLATKLSVTEIAGLCGFESPTHFGRVFKTATGFSPLQFRKKHIP